MVGHIGVLEESLGILRLLDGTGWFRLAKCGGRCESPAAWTYPNYKFKWNIERLEILFSLHAVSGQTGETLCSMLNINTIVEMIYSAEMEFN